MKSGGLGRLGFALAAVACLFAFFSASALAAGKPTARISFRWYHGYSGPNHVDLVGHSNPFGAATTLSLEDRKEGTSEWYTVDSQEIGSGTEEVETSEQAFLVPRTAYELRATATNSYGTSSELIRDFGIRWSLRKQVETSSYVSSGTFKLEYEPILGAHRRLECGESGFGEFGPGAKAEAFHFTASECSLYTNNEFVCHPKSFTIYTNSVYQAEPIKMELCPGEGVLYPIAFNAPFLVTSLGAEEWAVKRPTTMTAPAQVGLYPATVSVSSNWQLAGENVGKEFTFRENQ